MLAILAVWGLVVTRGFFQPGYPLAWDGPGHFVRLRAMTELFLPHGRTDGWCPWWYSGFAAFQFYPNLFFVALGCLWYLLLGLVPLLTLYKAAIVATWVLLPPAVYVLGRGLRLGRFASIAAAIVTPGLSAWQGIGIQGLFVIGLIPQGIGLILFALALVAFHRAVLLGGIWVPLTALAFATMACTHMISAIYLTVAVVIYVGVAVHERRRPRLALKRALAVVGLAAVMSAATLLPIVIYSDLIGPSTGWADRQFLAEFLHGQFFSGVLASWLALAFVLGIRRGGFTARYLVILVLITAPIAAGAITTGFGWADSLFRHLPNHRTFPYLAVLAALFAGGACDALRRAAGRVRGAGPVVAALLLSALAWETWTRVDHLKIHVEVDANQMTPERARFSAAYGWLRANSPIPTVIGYDDRPDPEARQRGIELGQAPSRLVLETDRFALLGNQIEATRAHNGLVLQHLHDWPPAQVRDTLARYNVSRLVAWKDDVEKNLTTSPDFQVVQRFDDVRVIAVRKDDGFSFASGPGVHVLALAFEPEHIVWSVNSDAPEREAVLAVGYHPNWQAHVNDAPVPVSETPDHLMAVRLPAGTSTLALDYVRPWWHWPLNLLSLAGLAATLWLLRR